MEKLNQKEIRELFENNPKMYVELISEYIKDKNDLSTEDFIKIKEMIENLNLENNKNLLDKVLKKYLVSI